MQSLSLVTAQGIRNGFKTAKLFFFSFLSRKAVRTWRDLGMVFYNREVAKKQCQSLVLLLIMLYSG